MARQRDRLARSVIHRPRTFRAAAILFHTVVQNHTTTLITLWCICLNTMAQNNSATDATLTEYLSAVDNTDDSIDGAAKLIYNQNPANGLWRADDGEELEEDPDEYRVECSCGETFDNWGAATEHAEEDH